MDTALAQLADAAGIEARYWDIHGREHQTSPDTMRALLRALGIAAGTDSDVAASLEALAEERWRTPLPPVVVGHEDAEIDLPLCLPVEDGATTLQWSVQLESGEIRTSADPVAFPGLGAVASDSSERQPWRSAPTKRVERMDLERSKVGIFIGSERQSRCVPLVELRVL